MEIFLENCDCRTFEIHTKHGKIYYDEHFYKFYFIQNKIPIEMKYVDNPEVIKEAEEFKNELDKRFKLWNP